MAYTEEATSIRRTESSPRTRTRAEHGRRPGAQRDSGAKSKKVRRILSRWLIGFAIFFDELVFKFSTTTRPAGFNLLIILLYSLVLGMLLWLLASVAKTRKGNRRFKKIILLVVPLLFCIEYFIYRQFKVFYDLSTIFNGAGHMLTGFMKETLQLVFSPAGIVHIFLFYLPTIAYFLIGGWVDACRPPRRGVRTALACQVVILLAVNLLLIRLVPAYHNAYSVRYNFQNAVDTFGLMPAVRLDIKSSLFGSRKVGFDTSAMQTEEAEQTPDTADAEAPAQISGGTVTKPADTPKSYGYNKLDIDFNALAEESGGTEAEMDAYVATLKPTRQNEYTGLFKGKNLIMITAEAFSGDIIDPELTPTLYRLATKGINFTDYTQSATAGTTGGEYAHIFGMLPADGGSSMNDTVGHNNYYTMGSQLNRLGYYGKAYHNNTYTYYDRNVTHVNLGYSDGFMGYGNGMEEYVEFVWPESDLEMFRGTVPTFIDKEHFNIYYMTVSGHNNYLPEENAMTRKHWDQVKDLPYEYEEVKGYVGCNLELEDALTYLLDELEKKGIADDTVICMTADHFPYGLDADASLGNMPRLADLYGYQVDNYFQRDHNRLIIWSGCLEDRAPIVVDDPVSCVDILPTLSNLFGLEFDSRLMPGRDVFSDSDPLVWTLFYDWKTNLGTYIAATNTFTPVSDDVEIPEDYVEKMTAIVSNKITFCRGCLDCDYFGHVFGDG